MNVLHDYELSNKMIAFCGDYSNTKFGVAARKGRMSVSKKLMFMTYDSLFTFFTVLFRKVLII
jgi:hypothetical protein